MPASTVCSPIPVTKMVSGLSRLMLPAITALPASLDTGLLSPVRSASSTALTPDSTVPSAGNASPGLTNSRSPGINSSTGTYCCPASLNRVAMAGASLSKFSAASTERSRAFCSKRRVPSRNKVNILIASKYTCPAPATVLYTLPTKAETKAITTGTSIFRWRLRSADQAAL